MALVVNNPPVKAGDARDAGSNPESGRSPGGGQCIGDPVCDDGCLTVSHCAHCSLIPG